MAKLPPRKHPIPTKISEERLSPLETLLQLGFPKHRAEKALAATGHRGVQLASDWLLAHVRDPSLDSDEPREYILYACPTGYLGEKLMRFWEKSCHLEWNKAHNCMPHMTLLPFFKVPDELAEKVSKLLENLITFDEYIDHLKLETYISPNFMGLFINDNQSKWLDSIVTRYVEKLSDLGITTKINTSSLHLSLAYQFSENLFQPLRSMVEEINPNFQANWELRLYSRDPRLREAHIHKVTHAHIPREHDELELRPGDFIYLREGACNDSIDGWVEGISWLTGTSGYLPVNHTKRTAETDSWTLHTTIQITKSPVENEIEIPKVRKPTVLSSIASLDTPDGIPTDPEIIDASLPPSISSTPAREIYICRHGERVDFTFGAWIPYCFEPNGTYIRRDLNMPKNLPSRNIQDFQNDIPLTTLGEIQANLVGEAMKTSHVKIDMAFTSPSLRCIQTLEHILKGFGSNIKMNVEPGFIEWLAWYPNGLPNWMNSDQLIKAGFNVDKNYKPFIKTEDLPSRENVLQYYERSHKLIQKLIDSTVGNILIVAHAASLAACSRQIVGGKVPSDSEVTRLVQRIPYLACLTIRQNINGWQLNPPPFPSITHTSNNRFDWKILM